MTLKPPVLTPGFLHELRTSIHGDVRTDLTSRILYSTDASIYQVEPLGVVFPHSTSDLAAIVETASRHRVPVLVRGAGSSLAGQAIGPALIVDCSRYLNRILSIDPERQAAVVEPGVILNTLNRAAARVSHPTAPYGLQFGPDPASAERATMGGSLANNAAGAHSILYGMAIDHLLAAEVVLSDGSLARLEEKAISSLRLAEPGQGGVEAALYQAALDIRANHADAIRARWPRTWRTASGYPLNYLLPFTASQPPLWALDGPYPPVADGHINLAFLLAGSEGTLAVIQQAEVRLVPRRKHTLLGVLAYSDLAAACDEAHTLLSLAPSAIELIPRSLVRLARSVPAYAHQLAFVDQIPGSNGDPAALLVVEFSGDDPSALKAQAARLGPGALLAESAAGQAQVWAVRKVGLGLLNARPGDTKPVAIIEDFAVPVERLGDFVRQMDSILNQYGTTADYYAHASAGCLHIRPLLDLKSQAGVRSLRSIAEQSVGLVLSLGGSVSGEHGDGQARGEWLERSFGPDITRAFRQLKQAADPHNLLNPGKIVDPPPLDQNLRYGGGYQAHAWQPAFAYPEGKWVGEGPGETPPEVRLLAAIEQCNGAGVCRKSDGLMCPSFQATQDEMHSTRGRANLLRALVSGRFPVQKLGEQAVREALDLCLACKGCKSECPSGVDVARLKYEFTAHYYRSRRRPLRDYLFGYFDRLARLGAPFGPLANAITASRLFRWVGERWLGLARHRAFPAFARQPLSRQARRLGLLDNGAFAHSLEPGPGGETAGGAGERVLFLNDAFTEYMHPEAGLAALKLLNAAGCRVTLLPVMGAGRTLISKGFLAPARRHARKVVEAIERLDPNGTACVVGVEPSEIFTLRDEFADLLSGPQWDLRVAELARRAWMIDEYLVRPGMPLEPVPSGETGASPGAGDLSTKLSPELSTGELNASGDGIAAGKAASGVQDRPSEPQKPLQHAHPGGKTASIRLMRIAIYLSSTRYNRGLKSDLLKPVLDQGTGGALQQVHLHTHCYQKTQPPAADGYPSGGAAARALLEAAGCQVTVIDAGCCGMAGAFGYEAEHFDISMKVGEDRLFPAVRAAAPEAAIAASGVSCRPQIEDGAGRKALHPVEIVWERLSAQYDL